MIILPILTAILVTCGSLQLDAGDPNSKDDSRPGGNPSKLLERDAPLGVLIEALQSGDFSTSIRAAEFLGYRGEAAKEAVPALVKALDVYHLRETALHALMNIGPHASAAIPALFKALTVGILTHAGKTRGDMFELRLRAILRPRPLVVAKQGRDDLL
ncbi:MAG: HEAT repeat domain-containing protein, partial [Thermoguttaceae bacterium]